MKDMNDFEKMVVLIDADNTQLSKLGEIFNELSTYGRIIVKKAYGNWRKQALGKWEEEIKRLAIKAVQQFDYVSKKNTTDIAMVIDAMDILHTGMYDAVVLVSSDSDFTPLAVRLKESGVYVIGVGERKTPEAFCNACDEFLYIENMKSEKKKPAKKKTEGSQQQSAPGTKKESSQQKTAEKETSQKNSQKKEPAPQQQTPQDDWKDDIRDDWRDENEDDDFFFPDIDEIHNLLHIAYEKYVEDDDFVNVSSAGTYIKRVKPEFSPYTYGYSKLSDLLRDFPELYQMKRETQKGKSAVMLYKCIDHSF